MHGLSIFLPLGEDLEVHFTHTVPVTPALVITRTLRETYTGLQLDFVAATGWDRLIGRHYAAVTVLTGTLDGPVELLEPDITPPRPASPYRAGPGRSSP